PRKQLEACKIVTKQLTDQRFCRAVVRRYDDQMDELLLVDSDGPWEADTPFERMKTTEGVNGAVFKQRKTIHIPDTHHVLPGSPQPKLSDHRTRSLLVTPIQL